MSSNDALFRHKKRDIVNADDPTVRRLEQAHQSARERMEDIEPRLRQTKSGAAFLARIERLRGQS